MTLRIEAGKSYKAETGERIGPMERWSEWAIGHPWQQEGGTNQFDDGGDIWRDDGTSEYHVPKLIEEWTDK